MAKLPETIITKINNVKAEVTTESYIREKTRWLREFGYPSVTEDEIKTALEQVLSGKTIEGMKDFYAMFVEKDVDYKYSNSLRKAYLLSNALNEFEEEDLQDWTEPWRGALSDFEAEESEDLEKGSYAYYSGTTIKVIQQNGKWEVTI